MDAIKIQQFAHKLVMAGIPILPKILHRWIHFRYNCDLSNASVIGKGSKLGHGCIGVVINGKSKIGEHCIIAQNVTLAGKDGGAPNIGNFVYLGANSVVLGGVKISDNAFVGALSLVNKDVPENAIVCGIPAKVLRIKSTSEIEEWHQWVLNNGKK